mmetsp:Transcript_6604/g.19421  ORF Transcript_6604/g.19421 Transcript_6604/m.19421 type:complete len:253 (-) Transcript_6604:710-1468(-)
MHGPGPRDDFMEGGVGEDGAVGPGRGPDVKMRAPVQTSAPEDAPALGVRHDAVPPPSVSSSRAPAAPAPARRHGPHGPQRRVRVVGLPRRRARRGAGLRVAVPLPLRRAQHLLVDAEGGRSRRRPRVSDDARLSDGPPLREPDAARGPAAAAFGGVDRRAARRQKRRCGREGARRRRRRRVPDGAPALPQDVRERELRLLRLGRLDARREAARGVVFAVGELVLPPRARPHRDARRRRGGALRADGLALCQA